MPSADGDARPLAELAEPLCRDSAIEFVVAFGSHVAGDPGPSSDIDLAVKFDDDLTARERFRKRLFLSGDLQQSEIPFVDLSDLDTLPLEVAHDAVSGELLCGDRERFREVKADIEAAFEERHDDIRRHQRAVIDRIAEEGLRG